MSRAARADLLLVPDHLAAVELLRIRLPLRRPFTTSQWTSTEKDAVLVRAVGEDGVEGWGECVAGEGPWYSSEWTDGAWLVLRDFLVPAALDGRGHGVRGHPMAAAALQLALVDLALRRRGVSLSAHLDGVRDRVECGVSLGLEDSINDLVSEVERFVRAGYRRVKLKIKPGADIELVRAVRGSFPAVPLTVDANTAYSLDDADHLAELDTFGLEYIEQPLGPDRLLDHAELQQKVSTPICLDETITSAAVAADAIRIGACRVINIKLGRVGGLAEAVGIHDLAKEAGVPVWCGGMLETGIGRATNLALASLANFVLPGDTSASDRYFDRDLTEPFVVEPDGTMAVPQGPGIGVDPLPDALAAATVERLIIRPR
ncbi:MAG: o-succinylbenzoate synthase [Actinomycetota bacterium]